jgi:hypothetical protein
MAKVLVIKYLHMPPTQPTPNYGPTMPIPTTPQDSTQYDFIVNNMPKSPYVQGSGTSMKTRIALVVGGIAVLGILIWVFIAATHKPATINPATLLSLAQKQTELARISQSPALNAVQQPTQNFAETMYLTLTTHKVQFTDFLTHHGGKQPSTKQLSVTKNDQTDTALKNAQATGTYDATYISVAQTQLNEYEQSLSQAYAASKSTSERQLLQDAYTQAQLLTTMSNQH